VHNSKLVEKRDSVCDLVAKLASAVFRDVEFAVKHIVVKISARDVLQNNEEELVVLEDVVKTYYVGVLRYLEGLNFLPLKLDLFGLHLYLFGRLHSEHFLGGLMFSLVDHAVLSFSELLLELIKVKDVRAS